MKIRTSRLRPWKNRHLLSMILYRFLFIYFSFFYITQLNR